MATQICKVFPDLRSALKELNNQFKLVGKEQISEALDDFYINTSKSFFINYYENGNRKTAKLDYATFLKMSYDLDLEDFKKEFSQKAVICKKDICELSMEEIASKGDVVFFNKIEISKTEVDKSKDRFIVNLEVKLFGVHGSKIINLFEYGSLDDLKKYIYSIFKPLE